MNARIYQVYWMNFQYYAELTFPSFQAALEYGKSKCFQHSIITDNKTVATWCPIGGLNVYYPELMKG